MCVHCVFTGLPDRDLTSRQVTTTKNFQFMCVAMAAITLNKHTLTLLSINRLTVDVLCVVAWLVWPPSAPNGSASLFC